MKYGWLLILLCIQCAAPKENPCPSKTCKDFVTQEQAQQAFDADKICLDNLDNDNDGIACEELLNINGSGNNGGGSNSGCPNTASCGCSGKTKNVCESTCCKWVVGSGCKCR